MERIEELIKALRCSCEVPSKKHSCDGCRYRGLEEIKDNIPVKTDIVIDGVEYWEYCDTEKIALECAEVLESVKNAHLVSSYCR